MITDYGPKPGGPTHPGPSTPPPPPPLPPLPPPPPPGFTVPGANTPLNALIDCWRACGKALDGIARLLTGRPV